VGSGFVRANRRLVSVRARYNPILQKANHNESEMALFNECMAQLASKNLTPPTLSGTVVYDNHLRMHE
jgi:hypothetical protein